MLTGAPAQDPTKLRSEYSGTKRKKPNGANGPTRSATMMLHRNPMDCPSQTPIHGNQKRRAGIADAAISPITAREAGYAGPSSQGSFVPKMALDASQRHAPKTAHMSVTTGVNRRGVWFASMQCLSCNPRSESRQSNSRTAETGRFTWSEGCP